MKYQPFPYINGIIQKKPLTFLLHMKEIKFTKAQAHVIERMKQGATLNYCWISHKWSLRQDEKGFNTFERISKTTAEKLKKSGVLKKLNYKRDMTDRFSVNI